MAVAPSLDEMSPDEWVEAMHALRDEVVEQAARALDLRTAPELVAPLLQQILDRYNNLELDVQASRGEVGSALSLEVRCEDQAVLVWAYPTEEYKSIVYTAYDYWWFDHEGWEGQSRDRHHVHQAVAGRLLEMLPWTNEDELLEIAAIEMASRAG